MIPTFTQGQIGKTLVGASGYVLDTVNLCAGLSTGSIVGIAPFNNEFQAKYNDGTLLDGADLLNTYAFRTFNNTAANNNGGGVEITFGSAKRVGRIKLSRYGAAQSAACDFEVSTVVGGFGTVLETVANISTGYTLMDIDCNLSYTYSETIWRVKMRNWNAGNANNMYIGEIEAYEWVYV